MTYQVQQLSQRTNEYEPVPDEPDYPTLSQATDAAAVLIEEEGLTDMRVVCLDTGVPFYVEDDDDSDITRHYNDEAGPW